MTLLILSIVLSTVAVCFVLADADDVEDIMVRSFDILATLIVFVVFIVCAMLAAHIVYSVADTLFHL